MNMNEFILIQNKSGTVTVCGNRQEAIDIEEFRGGRVIGRVETILNMLEVIDLFKKE